MRRSHSEGGTVEGASGRNRTFNLGLKRPLLCLIELRMLGTNRRLPHSTKTG